MESSAQVEEGRKEYKTNNYVNGGDHLMIELFPLDDEQYDDENFLEK